MQSQQENIMKQFKITLESISELETKMDSISLFANKMEKISELEDKNEYLSAKLKIYESGYNKGEKAEVLLLIELLNFIKTNNNDKLVKIFGNEASEGIQLLSLAEDKIITDYNELTKSKGNYKSDCKIRINKNDFVYSISIKSKNGAYPTILNHTPRSAKVFTPDGCLYKCLDSLDTILTEYIDKRDRKIIGEDISITKLDCTKDLSIKSDLLDVLSYFVFNGTGKGDSSCKANSIIEYKDSEIVFIKCRNDQEKKEYINTIYDRIIISLRDKGMPKVITDYCNPWVFNDVKADGLIKYKGCLHIRLK